MNKKNDRKPKRAPRNDFEANTLEGVRSRLESILEDKRVKNLSLRKFEVVDDKRVVTDALVERIYDVVDSVGFHTLNIREHFEHLKFIPLKDGKKAFFKQFNKSEGGHKSDVTVDQMVASLAWNVISGMGIKTGRVVMKDGTVKYLAVLDLDTRSEDMAQNLEWQNMVCEAIGVKTTLVRTGKGKGMHMYFLSDVPVASDFSFGSIKNTQYRDLTGKDLVHFTLDVKSEGAYVASPGSEIEFDGQVGKYLEAEHTHPWFSSTLGYLPSDWKDRLMDVLCLDQDAKDWLQVNVANPQGMKNLKKNNTNKSSLYNPPSKPFETRVKKQIDPSRLQRLSPLRGQAYSYQTYLNLPVPSDSLLIESGYRGYILQQVVGSQINTFKTLNEAVQFGLKFRDAYFDEKSSYPRSQVTKDLAWVWNQEKMGPSRAFRVTPGSVLESVNKTFLELLDCVTNLEVPFKDIENLYRDLQVAMGLKRTEADLKFILGSLLSSKGLKARRIGKKQVISYKVNLDKLKAHLEVLKAPTEPVQPKDEPMSQPQVEQPLEGLVEPSMVGIKEEGEETFIPSPLDLTVAVPVYQCSCRSSTSSLRRRCRGAWGGTPCTRCEPLLPSSTQRSMLPLPPRDRESLTERTAAPPSLKHPS